MLQLHTILTFDFLPFLIESVAKVEVHSIQSEAGLFT